MRTLARAGRVTYVGRNTFISMHVVYHESIDRTALEADNSSEIIKKDYLDLVTREEAEKFWNIRSAAEPRNLLQDTTNYAKVSGNLLTDSSRC